MPAGYRRTVQAERDLADIAGALGRDNPDLAVRFLDAAEETFDFLASHPGTGGAFGFKNARAAGTRVWKIQGFRNHLVFYRSTADGVDILRVLHGARDLNMFFGDT